MRKSSVQLVTQTSEPLIVVDESAEARPPSDDEDGTHSSSSESPAAHLHNQFLLSPWRDARETRKLSLPSPQCAGITASQVRRLSERGEAGSGPGPRQTEFLATLSQATAPTPGGRRHSVVTISKVPATLFGRLRRESVAVFPSRGGGGAPQPPPSTEPRGSVHNLQLDIMDDIVAARKVRMKLWNTSSEKVCELADESTGAVRKYTGGGNRRYSDFVGTSLAPIPSGGGGASGSSSSALRQRRASELPATACERKRAAAGIVCSNTDLISILSNLTSSSMEIDQASTSSAALTMKAAAAVAPEVEVVASEPTNNIPKTTATATATVRRGGSGKGELKGWEVRRARLKTHRSSSFDASVLHAAGDSDAPGWFTQRHLPMAAKTSRRRSDDKDHKVVWDGGKKASVVVDAQLLGNAIEEFLRRDSQTAITAAPIEAQRAQPKAKGWCEPEEATVAVADQSEATCETSICTTLKDLFVK